MRQRIPRKGVVPVGRHDIAQDRDRVRVAAGLEVDPPQEQLRAFEPRLQGQRDLGVLLRGSEVAGGRVPGRRRELHLRIRGVALQRRARSSGPPSPQSPDSSDEHGQGEDGPRAFRGELQRLGVLADRRLRTALRDVRLRDSQARLHVVRLRLQHAREERTRVGHVALPDEDPALQHREVGIVAVVGPRHRDPAWTPRRTPPSGRTTRPARPWARDRQG